MSKLSRTKHIRKLAFLLVAACSAATLIVLARWCVNSLDIWLEARRISCCKRQIQDLCTEIAVYHVRFGRLPSVLKELQILTIDYRKPQEIEFPDWSVDLKDPWGNDYQYLPSAVSAETSDYDLLSFGRDGKLGGSGIDADIHVKSVFPLFTRKGRGAKQTK